MEQANPYAAPKADLAEGDVTAAPLSVGQMLFSFEGRITRAQYWLYALACSLSLIVVITVLGFVVGLIAKSQANSVIGMLAVLVYLPLLWVLTALQAKRWHDRGKSGWWVLLGFVPLANMWTLIEVGFLPGTPGRNEYGPPPAR